MHVSVINFNLFEIEALFILLETQTHSYFSEFWLALKTLIKIMSRHVFQWTKMSVCLDLATSCVSDVRIFWLSANVAYMFSALSLCFQEKLQLGFNRTDKRLPTENTSTINWNVRLVLFFCRFLSRFIVEFCLLGDCFGCLLWDILNFKLVRE